MAKFYDKVGFVRTVEKENSVSVEEAVEEPYYGDVLRFSSRYASADKLIDDVEISNEISIIADDFAYANAYTMKYVHYLGANWKISSIRIDRPRIILTLGGVYNGPTPDT